MPRISSMVVAVSPTSLANTAMTWSEVLARGDAGERPAPDVWSPLEYGCHVRDVHVLFAQRLRAMLDERGGVLELPLIRNAKTVDPTDKASTPVIQIESAMGGAVELFEDAVSVGVTRARTSW